MNFCSSEFQQMRPVHKVEKEWLRAEVDESTNRRLLCFRRLAWRDSATAANLLTNDAPDPPAILDSIIDLHAANLR
jgi:hypothetical protein